MSTPKKAKRQEKPTSDDALLEESQVALDLFGSYIYDDILPLAPAPRDAETDDVEDDGRCDDLRDAESFESYDETDETDDVEEHDELDDEDELDFERDDALEEDGEDDDSFKEDNGYYDEADDK